MKKPKTVNGIPFAKMAKMSPAQQVAKCDLDLPPFLMIPPEERAKAWEKQPPRAMPAFHGEYRPSWRTDADHAEFLEATRRRKEEKEMEKQAKLEKFKESRPERSPKRPSREGLISVGDIAKEFKIIPREARGILRAAKIAKPAVGWAGNEAWAKTIRAAIDAGLKAEKPKKEPFATFREDKLPSEPKSSKAKRKQKIAEIRDHAIWSGKGKTKNGNEVKEPDGPTNIIEKKKQEEGEHEIVAIFAKENKKWKVKVDGATIKVGDTGKVSWFNNQDEVKRYAHNNWRSTVKEFRK